MKSCWLPRGGGKDCLLFLAGWGMGPEPFQDVDFGKADVLLVYDYRSIDDSLFAALPQEKTLHLLAWSMGVWAAAWLAEHGPHFAALRFSTATAIGGTLNPIDDQKGIPAQSFEAMLDDFSPLILENFYRSMFDSEADAEHFLARRPQRPWQELREELRCLRDLCRSSPAPPDISSRRIVTSRDRIFPARNQLRAWGRDRCEILPLPHFPFFSSAAAAWLHPTA
ncbi:pimeloyl-ACP methyl esterase BioG family protein [Candidatus Electronema sp. JM]|uniref:pimeloyl-ACP methyl esterase BioG family protein n=1 Tax=Candidatus Electronema sp. JM TaxID=3401571 RepID=UPI003AA9421E